MKAEEHRHPDEGTFRTLSMIVGICGWIALLVCTFGIVLIGLLLAGLGLWISGSILRMRLLGNAVRVGPKQHPSIHAMATDLAEELGIPVPQVFLLSGSGMLDAFAVRLLGRREGCVLLLSELVDLSLERNRPEELRAILAHELAHHALGHVAPWRTFLLLPARIVPFLGYAHDRACELSCDRVALALLGKLKPVQGAFLALATGSRSLSDETTVEAFLEQDAEIRGLFGFLAVIYSTHPFLTRRVRELCARAEELGLPQT